MAEVEHRLEKSVNQNVLVVAADASDKTNVKALVDQSIDKFNSVDYLILSAGMCVLKLFTDITPADFDSLIDANVRTAFNVLQAVLPQMAAEKFGVRRGDSRYSRQGADDSGRGYCAAKYALTGMIKCLAQEYKRQSVRFSLMHFGGVDSSFWDNIEMKVQRDMMLTVDAAACSIFFAATQESYGVMSEIILVPESHQII